MSTVNNGPQIVRTGLVLDLDASYMRSYSPNVAPYPTDLFSWTGTNQINCTLSRDTSMTRQYGSIPLKMVVTANDSYTGTFNSSPWNLAPATTGQTWTVSVYVKASVATTIEGPVVFECNSSGVFVNATSAGSFSIGTSWTRVSYTVTFGNPNTAFIQVRLDGPQTGAAGQTIWWDGLQVERASSATTFNPYYIGNTIWRDISGSGLNGTLTGGPLFNAANGGNIIFDGTDDYVIVPVTGSYSEYTFMFFCKWISNTVNGSRLFGLSSFGTYTVFTPSNVAFHYNQVAGSTTVVSSGINVGLGTWCHVAITVSALSSIAYIYINGLLTNGSTAIPYLNFSGNIYLGAQTASSSVSANCNIGLFQLYNRVLSAKEIMQNFQTDKSRFGL